MSFYTNSLIPVWCVCNDLSDQSLIAYVHNSHSIELPEQFSPQWVLKHFSEMLKPSYTAWSRYSGIGSAWFQLLMTQRIYLEIVLCSYWQARPRKEMVDKKVKTVFGFLVSQPYSCNKTTLLDGKHAQLDPRATQLHFVKYRMWQLKQLECQNLIKKNKNKFIHSGFNPQLFWKTVRQVENKFPSLPLSVHGDNILVMGKKCMADSFNQHFTNLVGLVSELSLRGTSL